MEETKIYPDVFIDNLRKFSERIVVTGACGFVGSVMCARLTELGHTVIAVDNNSRGLNKQELLKLPNLQYIERDCESGIADILKENDVVAVIHFAAATGDLTRPDSELNAINLGITQTIAKNIAEKDPYINLIFPTTSLALKVPDSGYVKSKEAAIAWLLSKESPLPYESLLLYRFFNNSGGYRNFGEFRQKEVHCFPRLFRALMKMEHFKINGNDYDTPDGSPARDYVHVLDSVDFMIYRMQRNFRFNHFVDDDTDLCEVGRSDPHTVLEILRMLKSNAVKSRLIIPDINGLLEVLFSKIIIGPRRDFDCGTLCASPNANIFHWRPLKTFEDILVDTFNSYYRFYCYHNDFLEQIKPQ